MAVEDGLHHRMDRDEHREITKLDMVEAEGAHISHLRQAIALSFWKKEIRAMDWSTFS